MQERKQILVRLTMDAAEKMVEIKETRSKQRSRRVTWNELYDEAIENFIQQAGDTLKKLGIEAGDGHEE